MFARITLDNDHSASNKWTREQWNELRLAVPVINLPEWSEVDEKRPYWYTGYDTIVVVDLANEGPILTKFGLEFRVRSFPNQYVAGKIEGGQFTIHCHIPNVGLLAIDELQVMEDACTHALQAELNDGWRIVAVCPPNAARRPDYVLGRTKTRP